MAQIITDKTQDLNDQLVYEYKYSALDVQSMSPREKIDAYINASHIGIDTNTVIYLVEAAYGIELS